MPLKARQGACYQDEQNNPTLAVAEVKRRSSDDYRRLVGDALIEEAQALGASLKGLRVLHLNSTATGGRVAELLNSLVPPRLTRWSALFAALGVIVPTEVTKAYFFWQRK